MGSILSLALAASLAASSIPSEKSPAPITTQPLTQAMLRTSAAGAGRAPVAISATSAAKQAGNRSWASRHPVATGALTGAVVGLGIGLISAATYECPEDRSCPMEGAAPFVWTMLGAAVGTCAGLIVSLVR